MDILFINEIMPLQELQELETRFQEMQSVRVGRRSQGVGEKGKNEGEKSH